MGAEPADRGGLVVSGEGEVLVPADEVYVVLFTGFDGSGFATTLSSRDATEIKQSLGDIGIDADDVELSSSSSFGGASVRVKVAPAELPDVAERVEQAVEDVVGPVDTQGLHLVVDDCTAKIAPARDDAVAQARTAADLLAGSVGVELGALASVTETAEPSFYFAASDPCDPGAVGDGEGLVAYDASLEVELYFYVSARFAIAGDSSLTAVQAEGHGEVVAPADRATVVVLPNPDIDPFASSGDGDDEQTQLVVALTEAGIEEDAVRFVRLEFGAVPNSEAVAVDVDTNLLPDIGMDVVNAVEDVRGSTGQFGVLFSSSTCPQLLRSAQEDAVADAEARMVALADAADIELGGMTEAVDLAGPGIVLPASLEVLGGSFPVTVPCTPDEAIAALDPYGVESPLQPFDAEPETSVASVVVLGRAAA